MSDRVLRGEHVLVRLRMGELDVASVLPIAKHVQSDNVHGGTLADPTAVFCLHDLVKMRLTCVFASTLCTLWDQGGEMKICT